MSARRGIRWDREDIPLLALEWYRKKGRKRKRTWKMERERDREISSFEKKSLARVQIFRVIFPSHSSNLRFNISRREKKKKKGTSEVRAMCNLGWFTLGVNHRCYRCHVRNPPQLVSLENFVRSLPRSEESSRTFAYIENFFELISLLSFSILFLPFTFLSVFFFCLEFYSKIKETDDKRNCRKERRIQIQNSAGIFTSV